jgi:hypothetical protein
VELCDTLDPTHIIRVIKWRWTRWTGHAARRGKRGMHAEFGWRNLRERNRLEDPGLCERIILKCIWQKLYIMAWAGWIWLRMGTRDRILRKR